MCGAVMPSSVDWAAGELSVPSVHPQTNEEPKLLVKRLESVFSGPAQECSLARD